MGVLSQLEPKAVFGYFETICGIPHGSGNTGAIADYLVVRKGQGPRLVPRRGKQRRSDQARKPGL